MSSTVKLTRAEKKEARQQKRTAALERAAKRPLNRFFHHIDRGSTMGREIAAGIVACILSVCGIFMNIQMISAMLVTAPAGEAAVADIAANGELICQMYMVSMLVAFAGTLLMGLVARLPLVQIPSIGLSTVLISTLGIGTGMTWQNLLALCFVSALVYVIIAAVPAVNKAVIGAIPKSVRQAAPAAIGVLLVFVCMQLTGIVQASSTSTVIQGINDATMNTKKFTSVLNGTTMGFGLFDFASYLTLGYKGDSYYPLILVGMGAAATAAISFLFTRKTKHPVLYALLIGTAGFFIGYLTQVVFYIKKGSIGYELDSLWGRLWMVGSEDAQHLHLSYILNNFKLGEVFTQGFDFTAFTEAGGNVALAYATAILTFLFMNIATTDAVADTDDSKAIWGATLSNALINVAAPVVGCAPVAVTPASVAAKRDGGRSGITAIVAAIGLLISAFVWIIPFIFCTTTSYDIVFNLYGHYGTVIQLMTEQTSFIVADGVMAIVGLVMIAKAMEKGFEGGKEIAPFLTAIVCTFFTGNLALGLAFGIVAHLLVSAFDRERSLTIGNVLAAVVSLAYIVVSFLF